MRTPGSVARSAPRHPGGRVLEAVAGWVFVVLLLTVVRGRAWGRPLDHARRTGPDDVREFAPAGGTDPSHGQRGDAPPIGPPRMLTLTVFLVFATCFWVNAGVNRFRFNVALALLASLPLLVLLARAELSRRNAQFLRDAERTVVRA